MRTVRAADPFALCRELWPDVRFYAEQKETIRSVRDDDKTFVVAGNMLGKDFVGGFVVLWYYLTRFPCKIVTTSVREDHLDVLWGEIDKFIRTCKYSLTTDPDNRLMVNADGMRRVVDGREYKGDYVKRMVANQESIEAFQGHHVTPDPGKPIDDLPRNLFVGDEASGLKDEYYTNAKTWAKRMLIFGNPRPCSNFFYRAVKGDPATKDPGGSLKSKFGDHYQRRVLRIRAEDSPNVKLGQHRVKKYGEGAMKRRDFLRACVIVPGVITFQEYLERRETYDAMDQCISLDADFYEGAEIKLFPPEWLNFSERLAESLPQDRRGRTIGVDTAEGGDSTAWSICDARGLIKQISKKTPDTSVIMGETLALMREYGVKAKDVYFDAGGGGKEHADYMRAAGYMVKTVNFGGAPTLEKTRRRKALRERTLHDEVRYVYKNRRCEMYGLLSQRMNPGRGDGFGIPAEYAELRRQLAPLPKQYDGEGQLTLPPKNKPTPTSAVVTLRDILGCSPDEADSLALAVFGLPRESARPTAGAF